MADNEYSYKEVFLTTIDNPYNPFTRFNDWCNYELFHGYNTLSYLDRVVLSAEGFSDYDQNRILESTIDEILQKNPLKIYRKVYPDSEFKIN